MPLEFPVKQKVLREILFSVSFSLENIIKWKQEWIWFVQPPSRRRKLTGIHTSAILLLTKEIPYRLYPYKRPINKKEGEYDSGHAKRDMFDNPGGKLGVIIKVVTVIAMVAAGICGIVIMQAEPVVGLIVIIAGPFVVWLGGLLILAFCTLCDDVNYIRLHMGSGKFEKSPLLGGVHFSAAEHSGPTDLPQQSNAPEASDKINGTNQDPNAFWYCRKCGQRNRNGIRTCGGCGAGK